MIDLHTHILYGVDDGAKTLKDSVDILEEAENAGFSKVVFSSHYKEEQFTVDSLKRYETLVEINNTKNSKVDIYLGNEIRISSNIINFLEEKKAITLNYSKYILFELPFNSNPINLMDIIFQIQANNFVPILAHPERYSYFYRTPKIYEELVEKGVLMQVNFGSFDYQYGKRAKIMVEKLLKANLVHFIASDVHRVNTIYPQIPSIVSYLEKMVGTEKVKKLTEENPLLVIENKDIKIENFNSIHYNFFEKMKMNKS